MAMKDIMQELEALSKARIPEVRKAHKEGKKVIEYTGNFIPEEMIRALGAEPYLMCRGGEPEPPEAVQEYMLRFMNPLARSMAGYYLMGLDMVSPVADVIVAQQTDNHVGRISELLEFKGLPVFKVGVPADWKRDFNFDYYVAALRRMQEKLEEVTGNKLDEDALKEQFKKTNRINAALRKLDELRKKENPPIGMNEFIRLNHYSFTVDPDVVAEKLEALYDELKDAPGIFPEGAPRILIAGHAIAMGDYTVPKLVEEAGGAIVADFMDEGIRPYKNDISLEGDPIEAFARCRYLEKPPVDIFQPSWKERMAYIRKLIEEYRVDGVLWYQLSFDEIYDMEYSCIAKKLGDDKVPVIKLETSYEYSRESMGPLTTRVESFVESLKEGK
jgi:benzoyl-CoA reductase/2-hydroxyglutaryl-CoA dehydratase subunit BcrC/BadD/HgdB